MSSVKLEGLKLKKKKPEEQSQTSFNIGKRSSIRKKSSLKIQTSEKSKLSLLTASKVKFSGANDEDGSSEREAGGVRFVEDEGRKGSDSSLVSNLTNHFSKDPSIRLYQIMPKGWEWFLNNGPPKKVNAFLDLSKFDVQYERLLAELELQREPMRYRWTQVASKKHRMLADMHNFNHFLEENEKKKIRAEASFYRNCSQRMQISSQMEADRVKKKYLEKVRDKLVRKVDRFGSLMHFEASALKETRYKSFRELMLRYTQLKSILDQQLMKMFRGREILERVQALHDAIESERAMTLQQQQGRIADLQLELGQRQRITHRAREVVAKQRRQQTMDEAERNQLRMSIKNMATCLKTYRVFTAERFVEADTEEAQMEAIGDLILDYASILPAVQARMEKERKMRERKSRRTQKKEEPAQGAMLDEGFSDDDM